ncbi:MAG TPA: hypothetical protein VKY85_23255 [Candidatus Angelobacter sp.]|nr:hypothetical protein [Candidatus Angelobacter sp.]
MRLYVLVSVLVLGSYSGAASFDKPRSKRTVDLGPAPAGFGARGKVTCYFFPHFMVKVVDMGEKGAESLAIVPMAQGRIPRCTRSHGKAEKVINSDEWSGYFKGVKGELVFFDADDGVNGGVGFAVYDSKTGKKIFEDSALGPLEFPAAEGGQVSIKYARVLDGGCNVAQNEIACWAQIQKRIGLENVPMPDCKKAYEESAQTLAKGRCEAQNKNNPQCVASELQLARNQTKDANSIISYPVQVVLGPQPVIKPMNGDVRCWPGD